jgi:hypothetical protein
MKVEQLPNWIPEEKLDFLSVETNVDHQVNKLNGNVIFKFILFSNLHTEKLSLRVMESFLVSAQLKMFMGDDVVNSKYNSIRNRIISMNYSYIERIIEIVLITQSIFRR